MIIKPLGKRVLIQEVKQEEITKSGIVLPGTASKEKPITGEVLAIGNEVSEVKVGEKVEVTYSNKTLKLVIPEGRNYYDVLREKLKWGENLC